MNIRVLISTALIGSWLAAPARATTLVRLSLEQLSQASSDIVRGHVVSQESQWNPAHNQIVTLTTIAVDQAVKGQPPASLVIEQLGGTVGNIRSRVPGTVQFQPQGDYLLFLEPAAANSSHYLVVGMMQGAYRIYPDRITHEERVIQPLGGFFYGTRGSGGGLKTSEQTIPLNQFRQQLLAALLARIVIPRGTSIPLTIQSTESRGVGRVRVLGRTAGDVYPSASVVIPAGSRIEGTAQWVSGVWRIRWTELFIRGAHVEINATSEEPAGVTLRGRTVLINVR